MLIVNGRTQLVSFARVRAAEEIDGNEQYKNLERALQRPLRVLRPSAVRDPEIGFGTGTGLPTQPDRAHLVRRHRRLSRAACPSAPVSTQQVGRKADGREHPPNRVR